MKVVTLAAGVAVGYMLGSRAGREKYEQILATIRNVSDRPSVIQAQDKAEELADAGADVVTAEPAAAVPGQEVSNPPTAAGTAAPRRPRRKPTVTDSGVASSPLV